MEVVVVLMIVSTVALLGARTLDHAYERHRRTYENMEILAKKLLGDERLLLTGRRIDFGYFGRYGAFPTSLQDLSLIWPHPNPYIYADDAWGEDYDYDGPGGTGNIITVDSDGADGAAGGTGLDADISLSFNIQVFNNNNMRVYVHDVNGALLRGIDTGDATTNGFHVVDVSFTDNGGTARTYLGGDLTYTSEGYWSFGPGLLAGPCIISITIADGATGTSSVDWRNVLTGGVSTITVREVVNPVPVSADYNSDNVYHIRLPGSISGTTL